MERFVRKATVEDLPVVFDLIESGRRIMRENGNPHQWGDSHPTVEQIEDDIANGCSYLLLTSSLLSWDQILSLIIKHLQGYLGVIGWRIPSAGKGFITFLLRPNAALYYQIFSRRAAELIEPRRWYVWEAEIAERPSALWGESRETFGRCGAYVERTRSV